MTTTVFRDFSLFKLRSMTARCYCSYKPIKRPNITASSANTTKRPAPATTSNSKSEPSLVQRLTTRIKAGGPITVAHYMKEVLTNPASGYYMSKDVFGQQGDFITSPEIVQIFGELVAVWLYSEWQKVGSPKPLQIIELGPGRGTLTLDAIRVLSKFGVARDVSIHFVEISPYLSEIQCQRICYKSENMRPDGKDYLHYRQGETVSGIPVYWYEKIEDVPKEFSIILAHEFFDALPIHKFQKFDDKWREILVDIDQNGEGNTFKLVASRAETAMLRLFLSQLDPADDRQHIEHSFETHQIVETIASRLESYGGFALIMDYGHFAEKSDTFRAFKKHSLHDPLLEPGSADLTADVDFSLLKRVAETDNRLITFGPVEQQSFLKKLGGDVRLEQLVAGVKPETADTLRSGYDMLTNPQKMGSRFKFFSMFPSVLKEHLAKFPVNGFD